MMQKSSEPLMAQKPPATGGVYRIELAAILWLSGLESHKNRYGNWRSMGLMT